MSEQNKPLTAIRVEGRYRHRKRGSKYEVVGLARMQIGIVPDDIAEALEKKSFVVYRSLKDDSLWVRPESEFLDGRFEELPEGYYLTRFDGERTSRLYYRAVAAEHWTTNRDDATIYGDLDFAQRDRKMMFTREMRGAIEIRHTRNS